MKAWMIVLLLAGLAWGQTRPATQPTTDAQFRTIIANLQRQIATLKAENLSLRKQLAARPGPTSKPVSLEVGMTLAEVEVYLGRPGWLKSQDTIGPVYQWDLPGMTFTCAFHNGKMISFTKD